MGGKIPPVQAVIRPGKDELQANFDLLKLYESYKLFVILNDIINI